MTLARQLLALCACLSVVTASAFSQDDDANPLEPGKAPPRIYVGPIGGFNQNYHTGGFASFVQDVNCPTFGTGDATGYYAGISAEYLLGDVKDARTSIIARLAYDVRPAQFSEIGDAQPSRLIISETEEEIINSTTEHVAEIKFAMINLDILFKYMIGNTRLGVTAGPSIGYALTGTINQQFNLVEPNNVQFIRDPASPYQYANFDRSIIVRDGDIPDFNALRFGIKAGLQYEINVKKMIVVPAVWYDFGLTKLTSTENWRVNAFQAGVDVRFAL